MLLFLFRIVAVNRYSYFFFFFSTLGLNCNSRFFLFCVSIVIVVFFSRTRLKRFFFYVETLFVCSHLQVHTYMRTAHCRTKKKKLIQNRDFSLHRNQFGRRSIYFPSPIASSHAGQQRIAVTFARSPVRSITRVHA